jgi:hypothetical protein
MRLLLDDGDGSDGGGASIDVAVQPSTDMGNGTSAPAINQGQLLSDVSMVRSGDYVGGGAALTGIAVTQAGVDPNAVAAGQALVSLFAPKRPQAAQANTPLALPAQAAPARVQAASGGLGWIAAAVVFAFIAYAATKK